MRMRPQEGAPCQHLDLSFRPPGLRTFLRVSRPTRGTCCSSQSKLTGHLCSLTSVKGLFFQKLGKCNRRMPILSCICYWCFRQGCIFPAELCKAFRKHFCSDLYC